MNGKPFLPSDLPRTDPLQDWRRAILAKALAHTAKGGVYIPDVVKRLWPDQPALQERIIQRAASTQASTTGWGAGLTTSAVGAYVRSLLPRSAAAQLFDASARVSLTGAASVTLPRPIAGFPDPTFVAEGGNIPVMQGTFDGVTVGPARKLAMIAALPAQLQEQSADTAELILRTAMDDAAAHALDAAVFSTAAGSTSRPAGLLNGVTALTATAGGGVAAVAGDAKKLVDAIGINGGGTDIAFYMNPGQAVALSIYAPGFAYPVIGAPVLAPGTVVAIDRRGIASGFSDLPDVTVSRDATVHFESATPTDISIPGSPPTVAGSVRSAFQSDLTILRLILPCAWTRLLPGMVQFVTGATW